MHSSSSPIENFPEQSPDIQDFTTTLNDILLFADFGQLMDEEAVTLIEKTLFEFSQHRHFALLFDRLDPESYHSTTNCFHPEPRHA